MFKYLNEVNSRYQNIIHQKWEKVKSVYTVLEFLLLQVFSKNRKQLKGRGKGIGGGVGKMQWVVWQCCWKLRVHHQYFCNAAAGVKISSVCRYVNIKCCQLSWTEYLVPRAGGKCTLLKPIQLCFPSSSYAGRPTVGYMCSHASQYHQALQRGLGSERMNEQYRGWKYVDLYSDFIPDFQSTSTVALTTSDTLSQKD